MSIDASDLMAVTKAVTKDWTKQRKAEERGRRSRASRQHVYSDRVYFSQVAAEILPKGYAHASGNGQYTVDKRQLFYADSLNTISLLDGSLLKATRSASRETKEVLDPVPGLPDAPIFSSKLTITVTIQRLP